MLHVGHSFSSTKSTRLGTVSPQATIYAVVDRRALGPQKQASSAHELPVLHLKVSNQVPN